MIPSFRWDEVVMQPWMHHPLDTGLIVWMGFLVIASCGLVGNYLMVRRMALMGDAISHSVLPGLAIAFLIAGRRTSIEMYLGAISAALVTVIVIEWIYKSSRIKQDAAMNIVFSSLFSIGVILITWFADRVDLDQECVLYGEITFIPLEPLIRFFGLPLGTDSTLRMTWVFLATCVCILAFYKQLLVTSFDSALADSMGIPSHWVHLLLMCMVSVIVVSAFESVGAILVVAMMILPAATAYLWIPNLRWMHPLVVGFAAVSSLVGFHSALWWDTSIASAMVIASAGLFGVTWVLHPSRGVLGRKLFQKKETQKASSSPTDVRAGLF
jgi:manganese/zinc/iron transport system permease protein